MAIPTEIDVRVYGADGKRRSFPNGQIDRVEFEVTDRGGYGQGSVSAQVRWQDYALSGSERVDVYQFGTLIYRGYLRTPERLASDAERLDLGLYGLSEHLRRFVVRRKYVYSAPTDLSDVFEDLANDYAIVAGRYPSLTLDAQTVGFTIQEFDARGTGLSEAFGRLCDLAPDLCYWGCDVTGGADRLYIRPIPNAIGTRLSVGGKVTAFAYPLDAADVVNTLYITGGQVSQPNLLTNASFEEVAANSETVGNLLTDYSFEGAAWTLGGGATIKTSGVDTPNAPRTGSKWLELDQNNETAEQTISGLDYTVPLVATVWARYEDATNSAGRTFTLEVEGLNSSDVVQTTVTVVNAQDPGSDVYRQYSGEVDFSGFSSVVKARFRLKGHAGSASNDGVIFDDAALYERDGVSNSGWWYRVLNAAKRQTLDWRNAAVEAKHGGYVVKVQPSGIVGATDYLEINTHQDARPNMKGNTPYTLALFVRGDGTNDVQLEIGVRQFKFDGTSATANIGSPYLTGNHATWQLVTLSFTSNSATAHAEMFIRVRNNNIHYIDAAALIEGSLPNDWYAGGYWPAGTYERTIDVTDVPISVPGRAPDGLSADAADSITDYGVREDAITVTDVTDNATAAAFALGYFNAHAVPSVRADLSVSGPTEALSQSGLVKLLNLPGAPAALWPARIRYSFAEGASLTAELGRAQPDMADLLRLLEARRHRL